MYAPRGQKVHQGNLQCCAYCLAEQWVTQLRVFFALSEFLCESLAHVLATIGSIPYRIH